MRSHCARAISDLLSILSLFRREDYGLSGLCITAFVCRIGGIATHLAHYASSRCSGNCQEPCQLFLVLCELQTISHCVGSGLCCWVLLSSFRRPFWLWRDRTWRGSPMPFPWISIWRYGDLHSNRLRHSRAAKSKINDIKKWPGLAGELLSPLMARYILTNFAADAAQDFPIWVNKRYLAQPALAKGDGPVGKYRRWARQFYKNLLD